MNDCKFMGYITSDLEIIPTKNGSCVLPFKLAINRRYNRADGEAGIDSTYITCELWDTGGERFYQMFKKGDAVLLDASAKNSNWIDKEGNERNKIVFRVNKFWPMQAEDFYED